MDYFTGYERTRQNWRKGAQRETDSGRAEGDFCEGRGGIGEETKKRRPMKKKMERALESLIDAAPKPKQSSDTRLIDLAQVRTVEMPKTTRRPRTSEEMMEFIRNEDGSTQAKLCNQTVTAMANTNPVLISEFHRLRAYIRPRLQDSETVTPEQLEKSFQGTKLGSGAERRDWNKWIRIFHDEVENGVRSPSDAALARMFMASKTSRKLSTVKTNVCKGKKKGAKT